ncbi:dihydrodipicolinate synthase family protein [Amycolatopsis cynarae]|uniref:Dihydrodipicolinate synthase family protein n=1 Tax=Amycolatopsis cynarae TaxID=2995223 RepID=A0ABY7B7T6_9PSEU|nr:dihydrodipicolinate synthase family protein [Amycolatopsis sp. HUAS 11-8]WAL68402.1 dihydrodipicolinate synthase family protein [Amycolatopsis sp. HUAS 11-8]
MGLGELAAKLSGVVAIPVTPFGERGAVDTAALERVLARIVDGGIGVVTPNGNTGEFYALTTGEARLAVEVTMSAVGSLATVVVGVGGPVPAAVAGARHARRAGAQAIMIHQPVHPYVSAAGWVGYHEAVAKAVPELGVVLYLRSPRIGGTDLARLREAAPNVIAVKYAVPDPVRFGELVCRAGEFTWIAGLAEPSAPGYFALGATGFTSGLCNVLPQLSVRLLGALRAGDGDTVRRLWRLIQPFEGLRSENASENNVSVVKEALAKLGVCRRDVRPPSHVLGEAKRRRVAEILRAWEMAG